MLLIMQRGRCGNGRVITLHEVQGVLILNDRYAQNNDYKNFKRVVHDAQNSSIENAPPLAHARTWFPEENTKEAGSSRRRRNNTTDNNNNGEDEEDEEIIISGIKENLKCPLTFQYLKEPMTSNKCKHSYEKDAITEYFNTSAQAFYITKDRQRVPTGKKTAGCPQSGCDAVSRPSNPPRKLL